MRLRIKRAGMARCRMTGTYGILLLAISFAVLFHGPVDTAASAPKAGESLRELDFVSPRAKLVTSQRVRVVVSAPANVSSFRARVNGKDATKWFKRTSRKRWAADLTKRRGLRSGVNRVIVTTRERGVVGKSIGSHRFILGKRSKPVASLRVRRVAGGAVATVKPRAKLDQLRVTLNGRSITKRFHSEVPKNQQRRLSPDDGLLFGRNKITIVAATRSGAFTRRTVVFDVARTHPLAAAGRDRRMKVAHSIRLSGARTRSIGGPVKYQWRIKRRPKGSKAKLRNASAKRPLLRPDENGRYEIELTTTSRGRTSRDVVTVAAAPGAGPIGVSLDTAVAQPGGGYAIELGGNCLPNISGCETEKYPYGDKPVQMILMDRDTLEVKDVQQLDGDAVTAAETSSLITLIAAANDPPPNVFIVLAAAPGASTATTWNFAMGGFMGILPKLGANGGWSAVGAPTLINAGITGVANTGETEESGFFPGEQRGYFQFDESVGRFAYLTGRYKQYNTAAGGDQKTTNTIAVADRTFPSDPLTSGCSGGFQVVVLRATTLDSPYGLDDNATFSTNCNDLNDALSGAQALYSALLAATSEQSANNFSEQNGPKLVLIQSIGQPGTSIPAARVELIEVSQFIDKLGGQAEVFNRSIAAADSRYALAGTSAIVSDDLPSNVSRVRGQETTAQYSASGVSLEGVLRSNQMWHYTPVAGGIGTSKTANLTVDIYEKSEPWPTGGTPGEANALAYISELYDIDYSPGSSCYKPVKPDVRSEYCDLTQSWGKLLRELPSRPYNSACGCSSTEWAAVVKDIPQEIEWVRKVYRWVALAQTIYGGAGEAPGLLGVKSIATDVANVINPPPGSQAGGWWADLTANIFNALALIPDAGTVAEDVTGWISALSYLAEDGLTVPWGGSSLGQIVETLASDVPDQLALRYLAASERLGHFGDLAVTDYGKLKAIGTSSQIQVDETTLDSAIGSLMVGAYRFGYAKMMGAAYDSYALMPNSGFPNATTPPQYGCVYAVVNQVATKYPFSGVAANGWIGLNHSNPALSFYNNGSPWMLVLGEKGQKNDESVNMPPQRMLGPIFSPIQFDGNGAPTSYGEYAPWWFRHNFSQVVFPCET